MAVEVPFARSERQADFGAASARAEMLGQAVLSGDVEGLGLENRRHVFDPLYSPVPGLHSEGSPLCWWRMRPVVAEKRTLSYWERSLRYIPIFAFHSTMASAAPSMLSSAVWTLP